MMNQNDMPQANWLFLWLFDAGQWLEPVVYLAGVVVAVWAYRRCRKCGYLVFAIYFALVAFWLVFRVPIWRAMHAHDQSDISAQTEQKIQVAEREAVDKVLAEAGHPSLPLRKNINFPAGAIALVAGVWLLARRETQVP